MIPHGPGPTRDRNLSFGFEPFTDFVVVQFEAEVMGISFSLFGGCHGPAFDEWRRSTTTSAPRLR